MRESSGSRTTRYEHNLQRAVVPEQSAVLFGLLMLRVGRRRRVSYG